MSKFFSILARGGMLLCTLYLALAQPGVPACWLSARACALHQHFSPAQAHHPHSHDYLHDLAAGQALQLLPASLAPAGLLIALLFLIQIWRVMRPAALRPPLWVWLPEPPPPRAFLADQAPSTPA
jgi:hypothetical protein